MSDDSENAPATPTDQPDPTKQPDGDADTDSVASPPLSELADRVGSRQSDSDAATDQFESVAVDEIDSDALWDELLGAETDADAFEAAATPEGSAPEPTDDPSVTETATTTQVDPSAGSTTPADAFEQDESVDAPTQEVSGTQALVDKRAYCQQCPFFSAPPAVSCEREETAIIEVIEDGRFRVENCPVVTDRGPNLSQFTRRDN